MKRLNTLMGLGALLVVTSAAVAESGPLDESTPKVLPVLVRVDSLGDVTSVSPSI